MEGQCPSAGNGAGGCFAITVNRKDDFDFGPRGFYWSIMDNRNDRKAPGAVNFLRLTGRLPRLLRRGIRFSTPQ
jgi:hypothetical protein